MLVENKLPLIVKLFTSKKKKKLLSMLEGETGECSTYLDLKRFGIKGKC